MVYLLNHQKIMHALWPQQHAALLGHFVWIDGSNHLLYIRYRTHTGPPVMNGFIVCVESTAADAWSWEGGVKNTEFLHNFHFHAFLFLYLALASVKQTRILNSAWLNPLQLGRGSWNGLRGKMLGSTTEGGCSTAAKACWSHWPGQKVDSRVSRWQNFKAR